MDDGGFMGKQINHMTGFLGRLIRNQAGNTMAIVAAAIIPLAGLIGGGLDMSRGYMARARMQQACDAAALAGRRAMTTTAMTDANKAEAKKFFDFNFPQGTFEAAAFTPVIQSKPGETTTVQVAATTTMPTAVMKIFSYTTMDLTVNCESRFDIGNTDVMLVFDTTGSMAQSISDGAGGTTTRLAALKQAAKDFYDTLGAGSDSTGRIRYGFMPYSSTVNVGYQLPASYLVGGAAGETWNYQSRKWTLGYANGGTTGNWTKQSGSTSNGTGTEGPASACPDIPADTVTTTTTTATSTSTDGSGVITTSTVTTRTRDGIDYTEDGACYGKKNNRKQDWTSVTYNKYVETKTDTATQTPQYSWVYGQYPFDVSDFVAGNTVASPAYNASSPNDANGNAVPSTSKWAGCIEERNTDSSINAATATGTIPATAYDLQIDTLPTNTATKWRPHWPQVEFTRAGAYLNTQSRIDGGWNACPSQSRRLTSYASRSAIPTGQTSSFDSYVDGLVAVGGTYHDIGMMWGARFLSPTGIFAADNATAPNGFNIARHIVFMTDGDMSAYDAVYGSYGYQLIDGRVAATSTDNSGLTAIHNRRLEMMCNAIKTNNGKQTTIWVIGFRNLAEGEIGSQLKACASSDNHWMMAYDGKTLRDKFKDIAKNIGGLRLSQ